MEFGVKPLNYDYRPDDVRLQVERYNQSAQIWAQVWAHEFTELPASRTIDFSPLGDGFYRVRVQARSTKVPAFGVYSVTPYNSFWIGKPTLSKEAAAGLIRSHQSSGPKLDSGKLGSKTTKSATKTAKQSAILPPVLKVDRIALRTRAQAGQPASLSVLLRNTSQGASQAGQQLLSITCEAPKGQTCEVHSRTWRVNRGIAPGRTGEQNLAGVISPSGPGTYKVTVVPKGAPRSAGVTASILVGKASGAIQSPTQVKKAPPASNTVRPSQPPTVPSQKLNQTIPKAN